MWEAPNDSFRAPVHNKGKVPRTHSLYAIHCTSTKNSPYFHVKVTKLTDTMKTKLLGRNTWATFCSLWFHSGRSDTGCLTWKMVKIPSYLHKRTHKYDGHPADWILGSAPYMEIVLKSWFVVLGWKWVYFRIISARKRIVSKSTILWPARVCLAFLGNFKTFSGCQKCLEFTRSIFTFTLEFRHIWPTFRFFLHTKFRFRAKCKRTYDVPTASGKCSWTVQRHEQT